MAKQGLLPVFAVYSTFLQRAYDQLIHDTALSDLHVVFAVDRSRAYDLHVSCGRDYADKTVYHECRVNVYVQGESVARQLIYRFYMHLKQDFGLSRLRGPRTCCHVHE